MVLKDKTFDIVDGDYDEDDGRCCMGIPKSSHMSLWLYRSATQPFEIIPILRPDVPCLSVSMFS